MFIFCVKAADGLGSVCLPLGFQHPTPCLSTHTTHSVPHKQRPCPRNTRRWFRQFLVIYRCLAKGEGYHWALCSNAPSECFFRGANGAQTCPKTARVCLPCPIPRRRCGRWGPQLNRKTPVRGGGRSVHEDEQGPGCHFWCPFGSPSSGIGLAFREGPRHWAGRTGKHAPLGTVFS